MKLRHENIETLYGIFRDAWGRVERGVRPACASPNDSPLDVWVIWMNEHDVLVVDNDDLLESLPDMVNFGSALKESVCIRNPADIGNSFLLVPSEFAQRVLVLGELF